MIHCPSCAAGMRFDIETQMLVCDHCDNSYDVPSIRDNENEDAIESKGYDAYVFICPSCGGELLTYDKNDAVGFCPFCDGASMIYDRIRKNWKPNTIIPFQITKEQCKKAYLKEARRHFLVSSKYKRGELIDSFRGIYMPYWTYDIRHKGQYHCEYQERDGQYLDTKRDTYKIDCQVRGYTHDASVSFDDRISENLAPYTEMHRTGFHPGYVNGFYAEVGDADTHEYEKLIKERMNDRAKEEAANYLYREKGSRYKEISNIPTSVQSSELTLHPVWFMSYRKKNRITYAAVNGETGKVSADFPLSPLRIILFALLLSGLFFALISTVMIAMPSIKGSATLAVCSLLSFVGSYYLQKSFLDTVSDNLRISVKGHSGSSVFGIVSTALIFGVLLIMNDGSYSQTQALFGRMIVFPSVIIVLVLIVRQMKYQERIKTELNKLIKGKPRDSFILLASKCFPWFLTAQIICSVVSMICIFVALADSMIKTYYYIITGVLAALVFLTAMLHIFFQLQAAKRRPPQMDKKGAYYDEN